MAVSYQSELLARILSDAPSFHRLDTESSDQTLSRSRNYSITPAFAHYMLETLKPGMVTLETGRGTSTLVFAMSGCTHTCVSPDEGESAEIKTYALKIGIDLSRVTFVNEPSERYLPTISNFNDLDIVLIDGKHSFPWPMIDWVYTADRLKTGGLMMLDDCQLRPVSVLRDFLQSDGPRWVPTRTIERTSVFQKISSPIGDVSWMHHPWTTQWSPPKAPFLRRAIGRLKRELGLRG